MRIIHCMWFAGTRTTDTVVIYLSMVRVLANHPLSIVLLFANHPLYVVRGDANQGHRCYLFIHGSRPRESSMICGSQGRKPRTQLFYFKLIVRITLVPRPGSDVIEMLPFNSMALVFMFFNPLPPVFKRSSLVLNPTPSSSTISFNV